MPAGLTMRNTLSRRSFFRSVGALGAVALAHGTTRVGADAIFQSRGSQTNGVSDWPEWRGRGRLGVWTETGLLDRFPERGLSVVWRTPIPAGYAGPAVAGGRVFVTDFALATTGRLRGTERIQALDQNTGRLLWSHDWEASYQ